MKKMMVLWLAMCLLLTGCGKTGEDSELTQLDLVLDWYPNGLHAFIYVAMEKGYYEEEGLQVNIRFPSNANDAISLVAAGQAELGLYYQPDVIQARADQNVPIKSIGAVVQTPLSIVLSLEEQGIQSPGDLEGKTVGYAGTELSEAYVRCMMEHAGADFDSVTMMDVGFDLMSSMTTGNVDATIGCMINHEVPQMREEGLQVSWMRLEEYGVPNYYEGVFLTGDRTLAEMPEALKGFLRASARGFADMQADPEEALQILLAHQNGDNFPLSESVERESIQMLLPLMETEDAAFLSQSDECWQNAIDWMLAEGLIDRAVAVEDIRAELE